MPLRQPPRADRWRYVTYVAYLTYLASLATIVVTDWEVASVSGEYFYKCRPAMPTAAARDDTAAARLWMESAQLAGIPA